jgi:hypothetical protein
MSARPRPHRATNVWGLPTTLLFLDTCPVILVDRGDDTMAAHAYSGPVAVQESAPPPAVGEGEGAKETATATVDDADAAAPAPDHDEDDDGGGAWDTASLYEEILDEVEAFEYSGNGEPARPCAALYGS